MMIAAGAIMAANGGVHEWAELARCGAPFLSVVLTAFNHAVNILSNKIRVA
jgi:hypothetical protein